MFQRYSKQREAVYNLLSATDTHPTADWIYAEAKKVIPDISIATVYRNLRELVRNGMAKSISTPTCVRTRTLCAAAAAR